MRMDQGFLTRLFWACACQENYSAPGLNLGELYEQIEDADKASTRFSKALFATDLSFAEKDQLENMNIVCFQAYEQQGVINGFRLGMRLTVELDSNKKCP